MAAVSVKPRSHIGPTTPFILKIDWMILVATLVIAFGGVAAIRSATHWMPDGPTYPHKQELGIFLGAIAMLGLGAASYVSFARRGWRWLYYSNLLFLFFVVVHGHSSHGASRWIPLGPIDFQPSEFAKFAMIVSLAVFLTEHRDQITNLKVLLKSLAFVSVPIVLIFKQPDLGTALVLLTIWFGMVLIAGARWAHLGLIFGTGILLFAIAWHTPVLKDYQKQRLTIFLHPELDRRDTGYHLRQSEIAVGSGGLTGQGYEQGMQANGHFIPEQQTDFIFTIVGEEGGLLGCCILVGCYLILLQRCIVILIRSEDPLGRLIIAGVVSMLAFHVVVNIGMTIGVMPVTGVPLPFFSYGLSALIIGMASLGLVLSVAASKGDKMFS